MDHDRLRLRVLGISAREEQILTLICQGRTNHEIASQLYLSINTVKTYIRSAYRKIDAETRTHAVLWALEHGLGARPDSDRDTPPTPGPPVLPTPPISDLDPWTEFGEAPTAAGEIAAILGHDLGTPLTAIKTATEEALAYLEGPSAEFDRERLATALRECLSAVLRGTHRIEDLRGDLRRRLHLDGGLLRPRPELVGVRTRLESAATLIQHPNLHIRCNPYLRCWVQPEHLEQILTNLLTNAHKYTHGAVHLAAHRDQEHVVITITDHGPGITPEFRAHLFEAFSRPDLPPAHHDTDTAATTGDGDGDGDDGTGLGLYIVRRLCLANHGEVTYTPTPDGGSTFSVILPAAAPDPTVDSAPIDPAPIDSAPVNPAPSPATTSATPPVPAPTRPRSGLPPRWRGGSQTRQHQDTCHGRSTDDGAP